MKKKKTYQKPEIKRVKLKIRNAILADCNTSANITPLTAISTCLVVTGCYNPPSGI